MSASLFKATMGLLVNKAGDSAARELKDGDVMYKNPREPIQQEINDIKSKLDVLSRKDLLTAIDLFETGFRYLCQALKIDFTNIRSATSTKEMKATKALALTIAIEPTSDEARRSILQASQRLKMAREKATKAFNNETLETLQRITALRYRVLAAALESVAESLEAKTDLSSLSLKSALQSARPECTQSLEKLHSLPDVKKSFEVELRSGPFNFRGLFGREERRKIICAVCQVHCFIHDALVFDFDAYDSAAIKIGEKSINPLSNRKVNEVLEKVGMQHCCIEWSFGHNGEEEHRLKKPSRIASNTHGELLVVDKDDKTVKVFDSSGEFIYKINPQVDDTVTRYDVIDVATDVDNNTYILVWLNPPGTDTLEVQVFTKTEMCKKFPVSGEAALQSAMTECL